MKGIFIAISLIGIVFFLGTQRKAAQKAAVPSGASYTRSSGNYDFSLAHGGSKRTYSVHVPKSYDPLRETPVVLVLHGGGGDAAGMKPIALTDEFSEEKGFIAVYPEGSGKRIFGKTLGSWNAGRCCPPAMDENADDVGLISSVIDDVSRNFNVDKKRVYATGISNGAQMSYRLACELSDKIAAIAPIAGQGVFEPCDPKRPVPVIHFHGTEDTQCHYNGGTCGGGLSQYINSLFGTNFSAYTWSCEAVPAYIETWKKLNGVSGSSGASVFKNGTAECVSYGRETEGEVILCTIGGAGHTWPGGTYGIPCQNGLETERCRKGRAIVGELSNDISANKAMWEFFIRHPMPE